MSRHEISDHHVYNATQPFCAQFRDSPNAVGSVLQMQRRSDRMAAVADHIVGCAAAAYELTPASHGKHGAAGGAVNMTLHSGSAPTA